MSAFSILETPHQWTGDKISDIVKLWTSDPVARALFMRWHVHGKLGAQDKIMTEYIKSTENPRKFWLAKFTQYIDTIATDAELMLKALGWD